MNLIEQRESWTKEWEAGVTPCYYQKGFVIPPEKIDEYRLNKLNPLWRASVEHERICDYLIWRGCYDNDRVSKEG